MNKIELINYLIKLRNYNRYLEITVHNVQDNFVHIQCADKKQIISGQQNNYQWINDDNEGKKFDIIFIDGIHTEEQVASEIEIAYHCLSGNGVIIIHDCMPPDEWHQRDMKAFKEGENWNGTVWKAVLRTFNNTTYKCTLLDTDWGCGLIDMTEAQIPKSMQLPERLDYQIHYPWLLEYKKSVGAFLREKVSVFYHLACMGNWQEVYKEQMLQLQQNGFQQINLTVLGTKDDLDIVNSINEALNINASIVFKAPDLNYFETPALIAIEEYARKKEGYVLYLHSKGVSNPADQTKIKWRRLMMKELVDKWEYCMPQLPYYDMIGVNWREMPPVSHFCGNFWYASTKYLRKLADFSNYYNNTAHSFYDIIDPRRLNCEFWISSSAEPPKLLSLYCRDADFCNHNFWRNK
jgi:hypothetical protein